VTARLHVAALRQRTARARRAAGATQERVLRQWARRRIASARPASADREDFLPQPLRAALPALEAELDALAVLRADHTPAPTARAAPRRPRRTARAVEAVLLPARRPVACRARSAAPSAACFCMTRDGGLERQLGSAEIVAQVALARRLRAGDEGRLHGHGRAGAQPRRRARGDRPARHRGGIGHKSLVFSTVGDRRAFERLPQGRVRPALALSLHSTDAASARRLLPRAPRIAPDELVALGDAYARATGYRCRCSGRCSTVINDGADEIDGLRARPPPASIAVLNSFRTPRSTAWTWQRPAAERSEALARELHRRGILTKLRARRGRTCEAGCGQLRARHERSDARRIDIATA
jgi:23S rRNA (adenine2503-C2)-methyltransferase